MPEIPGVPDALVDAPGVEMNVPPAEYLERTTAIIQSALSQLEPGKSGALTWIASTHNGKVGVNLAIAQRVNDDFQITAWFGKTRGEPIAAGIAGKVTW